MSYLDNLAAGDEVEELTRVMREVFNREDAGRPLETVRVPQQGSRLSIPPGPVHIDFADGRVSHQGALVGTFPGMHEINRNLSEYENPFRSLMVSTTAPADTFIQGSKTSLGNEPVTINHKGFNTVRIASEYPVSFRMLASTHEIPQGAVRPLSETYRGDVSLSTSTWTDLNVNPTLLYASNGAGSDPYMYAAPYEGKTIIVGNTSGNGNDIDARVVAQEQFTPDGGNGNQYVIGTATAIADGSNHVFHVTEAHRWLGIQVSQPNGNSASAELEATFASE